MKRFGIVIVLLLSASAFAQTPVLNLVAPSTPGAPGKMATLDLVVLNTADYTQTFTAPKNMMGEISTGGGAPAVVQLRLTSIDPDENEIDNIAARGFAAYSYAFAVPENIAKGDAILTVRQPALLRMAFAIDGSAAATGNVALSSSGTGAAAPASPVVSHMEPKPVAQKVKRAFAENFAAYEPMYFIMGFDKPAAKFQFSFQYQVLGNEGYLARTFPLLKGLRFAYTQRSLWDITSESSPFYDTSYMPELFFVNTSTSRQRWGWFTWLGLQGGVGHESNGRGGDDSRSLNRVFGRASFAIGNMDGWRLIISPRVWGYIGDMSDNPDLNDYRGYMDLTASFGKNDSLNVSVWGRAGQNFKYGALQVDVTYPVDVIFKNVAAYFLVQYWNGYSESLLNYNKRTETVRFGFALVR